MRQCGRSLPCRKERPCSGRSLSALGDTKIAFRCLWHAIVVPPSTHRGFTQGPSLRSARAMTNFWRGSVGTYHPLPQTPHGPRSVGVRAECPRPVWVGLSSGQGVSNLYQPPRKAISAFWRPPPDLLLEDPLASRLTPPWVPRRGTRSPDIDSGLSRGVSLR